MPSFTVLDHPLAGDLLTRLRDETTGPAEYRALTRRLGLLLVVEATRDLATSPLPRRDAARTLRGHAALRGPRRDPRAARRPGPARRRDRALPRRRRRLSRDGTRRRHPRTSRLLRETPAHGGPPRIGASIRCSPPGAPAAPRSRYVKEAGATGIVVRLRGGGARGPRAACRPDHPDVPDRRRRLDRQLNEHAYIVPGLGDFGDRLYGTRALGRQMAGCHLDRRGRQRRAAAPSRRTRPSPRSSPRTGSSG